MPYNARGQYQPILLVQNIIDISNNASRYNSTLPYIQTLRDEIEETAISQSACQSLLVPVALSVGGTSSTARYLSFYTNVALGRTLGIVFNIFTKLCAASSASERRGLHSMMVEQKVRAKEVMKTFRSTGIVDMEEDMRAHLRSMEVCAEGLSEWIAMIGELC
jgi:hypothetical protein